MELLEGGLERCRVRQTCCVQEVSDAQAAAFRGQHLHQFSIQL